MEKLSDIMKLENAANIESSKLLNEETENITQAEKSDEQAFLKYHCLMCYHKCQIISQPLRPAQSII